MRAVATRPPGCRVAAHMRGVLSVVTRLDAAERTHRRHRGLTKSDSLAARPRCPDTCMRPPTRRVTRSRIQAVCWTRNHWGGQPYDWATPQTLSPSVS